jgi:hypothetical protein
VEGEYKPSAVFNNAFEQWCYQLSLFAMKCRRKDTAKAPLVSISSAGEFVLQQPLVYSENDYFTVSKAEILGGFANGRFHVAEKTDDQHGTFSNWTAGTSRGGTVKLDETFYPNFENFFATGVFPVCKTVVRKVGAPFGGYVGRASKRA